MALLVPGTVLPDSIQRIVLQFLNDTAAVASVLTIGANFSAIRWVTPNLPGLALHMFGFSPVGINLDGTLSGEDSDLRVIRLQGGSNPFDDGASQTYGLSQLVGAQALLEAARAGSGPFGPANYRSFYDLLETGSNGLLMLGDLVEGRIEGTTGNDTLQGGSGNNVIFASEGNDTIDGGGGRDMLTACHQGNAVVIDLDSGTGTMIDGMGLEVGTMALERITSLRGSQAGDVLTGNDSRNVILGCDGDDLIRGAAGRDRLDGEKGNDTVRGGQGDDLVQGASGDDVLFGDGGNDRVQGGAGDDRLDGGAGIDTLSGDGGADTLAGGEAGDSLEGGKGADSLDGGTGEDTMYGGSGHDTLTGDFESDFLSGDGGNDLLFGGAGVDTLRGGSGDDSLLGGADKDFLFGGTGSDTLDGEAGADTLEGGRGDDLFHFFGGGRDLAHGQDGNDTFDLSAHGTIDRTVTAFGGVGDDVFRSGAGEWAFFGAEGNDRFEINDALVRPGVNQLREVAGGDGEDVFVLNAEQAHVVIRDFFPQTDVLILGFLPGRVESILDVGASGQVNMRSGGTYTFLGVGADVLDLLFA